MKKNVAIIGGGIAGLNAGVELLQHGYDVSLYEKNEEVGGLCSGYFVDGYNVDCCLHWLMGTKKRTIIGELWRNNDALNDDVEISHLPYFCTFNYQGTIVTLSRNLDEEEARWLVLAPEDKKQIISFFECVRSLAAVWSLTQNKKSQRFTMDLIKTLPNSIKLLSAMKSSRKAYSKKFTNPALRFAVKNGMTGYNNAFFFMLVYGLFSSGDGDVPLGGAYYMVQRIKNKFLSLGGKLFLNSEIEKLNVEDGEVISASYGNNKIEADYFISAFDTSFTLNKLLDGKYKLKALETMNKNITSNSISSSFCVYIKVDSYQHNIETPTCVSIDKTKVGKHRRSSLLIRPYDFDTTFNYGDSAVISLFIDQDEDDYWFFKEIKNYEEEYNRIVKDMLNWFIKFYPEYDGKYTILTSFGPLELEKRTNTSYGALQSFSFTDKGKMYMFNGKIKQIDNLYFCGQWNRSIGGTPTALLTSHDIVEKILKRDKENIAQKLLHSIRNNKAKA